MRDRPNLPDAAILDALRMHYGLDAAELTFLPLGADSGSAVFRASDADGAAYLVKLRADGGFSAASLSVPHYLHVRGVPHLVAPLSSANGALWAPLDGFALALYPFLDVRMAAEAGLADAQWRALGATMRQIHDHTLPPSLQAAIPRERFVPSRRELLPDLERILGCKALDDVGRELAARWRRRRETIYTVTSRADALGRALREATPPLPLALCHGDLHTWNILLDDQQQWWLVD